MAKCLTRFAKILTGAQQCAAHGLHRPTHERPAPAHQPEVPTRRWYSDRGKERANVTGKSARAVRLYPSWALGLCSTDAAHSRSGQTSPGHPAVAMEAA